jgi:hypothetical protein
LAAWLDATALISPEHVDFGLSSEDFRIDFAGGPKDDVRHD